MTILLHMLLALATAAPSNPTIALYLFDEPAGAYPSSLLNDAGPNHYNVALGRGGCIVNGKFGRALEPCGPRPLDLSKVKETSVLFGLAPAPRKPGRTMPPLQWSNATFAALATTGEQHLRSPGFANVTKTKLNLGAFDWTIELWLYPTSATTSREGIVFEIGEGPRGENNHVTSLMLDANRGGFTLVNQASGTRIRIPTVLTGPAWHHLAFTYTAAENQLRHYVDGKLQPLPAKAAIRALAQGEEAYFTIGTDGKFTRPLQAKLDELRFSEGVGDRFAQQSYSTRRAPGKLLKGPPLLFGKTAARSAVVALGSRKHLFLDDSLIATQRGIRFVANAPRRAELVLPDGARGHLAMAEDEQGMLRLYYRGPEDSLAVMTSKDGIHWSKPDLGNGEFHGERNIAIRSSVGLGNVFLDPNAPPAEKWKYFSAIRRQPMFVYSSPDGLTFQKNEVAALPFAAGSQSVIYYDDQRQLYVGHHRSDYGLTPGGHTMRRFVLSETKDLMGAWPFTLIPGDKAPPPESIRTDGRLDPWYLDNGPLAPSGIGRELPTVFASDEKIDPVGTDVYVTKVTKYPWAPDAYLAFPSIYFHYDDDGPPERRALGAEARRRGSGVNEVQLAVSRDGLDWKRYPRPAYAPIGGDGSNSVHQTFLAYGMFRRGDEIWQYVGGHGGQGVGYHSAWKKGAPWPMWRLVQRLDGFVAAEADYAGGTMTTKPLIFEGDRLRLNIDTGATGYAQVGILDENGAPIPGYSVDECVYINGDFLSAPVEWMSKGTDLRFLAGKKVQVVFRMRGAKVFAMQFGKE